TQDDAIEYKRLRSLVNNHTLSPCKKNCDDWHKYEKYHYYYDWRPRKHIDKKGVGILTPDGRELLPAKFNDIFIQFDAINNIPDFIPVYNGKAWGIVSLSSPPILVVDFKYQKIIPDRWNYLTFFVQDKNSLKWGALGMHNPQTNDIKHVWYDIPTVEEILPPISDEIFEDEILEECFCRTFYMLVKDDKIGVLNNHGYTDIIYDYYVVDDSNMGIRLYCGNECKKILLI
ncbi:MAG: hypothetical protein J1E02_02490, partial [Coprobacter sp.]|nr:hypothetical protein [Coprobacter sp.]